jgi:hypothetical protein
VILADLHSLDNEHPPPLGECGSKTISTFTSHVLSERPRAAV